MSGSKVGRTPRLRYTVFSVTQFMSAGPGTRCYCEALRVEPECLSRVSVWYKPTCGNPPVAQPQRTVESVSGDVLEMHSCTFAARGTTAQ